MSIGIPLSCPGGTSSGLEVSGELQFEGAVDLGNLVSYNLNDDVSCLQLPQYPERHEVTGHMR